MDFQKLMETRRSVRKYVPAQIRREDLEEMILAALEAPSWKNTETGRYHCVLSRDLIDRIRTECLPPANCAKAENAALVVATYVKDKAGFQTDGTPDNELGNGWGCYDLGLQNENFLLKATELGYATLVMGIRDAGKIREILSIPEDEIIVSVLAVGKAGDDPKRPKRKELEEVVKFYEL